MPGDEDYSNNLPALGRFKPGYIAGAEGETGELDVTLSTNLAGEPIRFTMNESLDNIVSSATLTMLNATIGDGGIQYDGVMGEEHTEEDEAQWGTLYESAPVEPNQLVTVTEAGGGLGTCTTYWRVVGVTAYLDENDVPYYEVQLEGMGQIAIDTKFDPSLIVSDTNAAYFVLQEYYDDVAEAFQVDLDNDGYVEPEEQTEASNADPIIGSIVAGSRYLVESPDQYLSPFLAQITAKGLDCGDGATDGITLVPFDTTYTKGEGCWNIISDILGFAGKMARFKRDKRLVVMDVGGTEGWSYMPSGQADDGTAIYDQADIDNPPLQDTDIGNFGAGLQLSYSKEGVYSQALVSGFLGSVNEEGKWITQATPTLVTVTSNAGKGVLNGEIVELVVQVDERHRLAEASALENFGKKELYKTVIGAKSATYDSESVPLAVEVGMNITGSSKLGGTTSIFITALNRTTDAQQNKITTGISGTRVASESDSVENNMGWE